MKNKERKFIKKKKKQENIYLEILQKLKKINKNKKLFKKKNNLLIKEKKIIMISK